ncbi:hypothetical protein Pr1d_31540 [Bythopirellula goksoeyrii]|uniref:Uncharacterized protein n=1 Tax=Bythopirellula goksoeyrii TaxID=1400387 RepID=A0A5B9QAD7_9BACT|nr:hypothetical protein Pr1d_31540 [Bythopirellula goksoeyrii]
MSVYNLPKWKGDCTFTQWSYQPLEFPNSQKDLLHGRTSLVMGLCSLCMMGILAQAIDTVANRIVSHLHRRVANAHSRSVVYSVVTVGRLITTKSQLLPFLSPCLIDCGLYLESLTGKANVLPVSEFWSRAETDSNNHFQN